MQRLLGLYVLNLDQNKITAIPSSLVQAWKASETLNTVSLVNNPFQRDGNLADFVTWIKTPDGFKRVCESASTSTTQGTKCPVCDSPKTVAGQSLDHVDLGQRANLEARPIIRGGSSNDDYSSFTVSCCFNAVEQPLHAAFLL